ncbi:MAG: 23S rRNA G2069 N7-methylase RlmK/C1962 C5-methylase RlmI [Shewanella psychromarinicola]|uniref:hypothetical protein n=1 Tax=Shewanella psychromarinicola TaxID=2487742 RepID=UPI003EF005F9
MNLLLDANNLVYPSLLQKMVANAAQNTKRKAQFIERVHQQTNNYSINSPLPNGDVFKSFVGKVE